MARVTILSPHGSRCQQSVVKDSSRDVVAAGGTASKAVASWKNLLLGEGAGLRPLEPPGSGREAMDENSEPFSECPGSTILAQG